MKWHVAGSSPLVLPAITSYTNHTRAEIASSIAETCRTVPIALEKCKQIDQGIQLVPVDQGISVAPRLSEFLTFFRFLAARPLLRLS